ncbi:MAG: glycosyltransferase [Acidobacteria bacterium]|nr:glycosyltransferase [Acidobacteriota bacterium]
MRVLHLTSFDRWTGASAPAFAEVEALREKGVDAHYAFATGASLESKLGHLPFTHSIFHRAHTPRAVIRSVNALRALVREKNFELIHCHLSHDHWLGYIARRPLKRVALVRTFHARRAFRGDLLSRRLVAGTDAVAIVSPALADHPLIAGRSARLTPPPAEPRYRPDGPDVRSEIGVSPETFLLGFIGKISPGRGFEDAIRTLALLRLRDEAYRLLIIGRGDHRPKLEELARELRVDDSIIWAGYHEDDLPEHFRAIDLLLFTARGSDEGHRAIIEAMACGTPAASYPIPGTDFVLGSLASSMRSPVATPEALAALVHDLFAKGDLSELKRRSLERVADFAYGPAADRLLELYDDAFTAIGARP